jgi:ankyrin
MTSIKRLVSSIWHTTPLHKACAENYVVVLRELLASATHPTEVLEYQSSDGWTPLHTAVFLNHLQIVKILLENGADPLVVTSKGVTAFHIACSRGHVLMLKLLMSESSYKT